MNHDILKRLGLDHLDVASQDFLDTLNRLQHQAREDLREVPPSNDPEFSAGDDASQFPGFDWMPMA
jgi:hypothetical protein